MEIAKKFELEILLPTSAGMRGSLPLQSRRDSASPHRGALRQHDGSEKQKESALHLDARQSPGLHGQHQDRDDEDIEHGPFA